MSGISAQNSKLFIATGTGTAKSITAITPGNPTIVTSAAHGFQNGFAVDLSGIVGTIAAGLNGTKRVVSNVTANTYAILDFDSTGLAYTSGGSALPAAYTQVKGFLSYDGFDGAADDTETTDLDSTAKEFISGLIDNGKFGFEIKRLAADPGQIALRAARTSGATTGFRLQLPDFTIATYNALVKTMPVSGAVGAVMKGKVDTKIDGAVVWS